MSNSEKILFMCVENAGRSQMAEGFFHELAPQFDVISAGTHPKSVLNPKVVQVMNEIGIDITKQKPKKLTNEMITNSITVNMGCVDKESCPSLFVKNVIDWNVSDPKEQSLDSVRKIRDQIKSEVLNLINSLEENN